VAFLGLAKNAGKTTALNSLAAASREAGDSLILASIGRDGEALDAVTMKPKPPVHVRRGDLVVTTDSLMKLSELKAAAELDLKIETPLGNAYIYRILTGSGTIVLAGVNHISSMLRIKKETLKAADRFFIDGAINRRSSGVPELADGVIISTGAVLGRSCDEVIRRTDDELGILSLPGLPSDLPEIIYHKGALTRNIVIELLKGLPPGRNNLTLAAEDSTKIFLPPMTRARLANRGITLGVVHPLRILAITVNPHNPSGPDLPAAEFKKAASRAFAPVPVFNIIHSSEKT